MRKSLLIIALMGILSYSVGQHKELIITQQQKNHAEIYTKFTVEQGSDKTLRNHKLMDQKDDAVGQTYYDLQTYNSLQRRMYTWPDGSTGVTWAMAFSFDDWEDLGTGYNFNDGESWAAPPTQGLEENHPSSSPNYYCFGGNGEIVVSHYLGDHWKLAFYTRENRGEGVWEKFELEGPEDNVGIAWSSVMVNGPENKTIHVLAKSTENPFMGQTSAFIYNRSSDGGNTWDIEHYYFEELGLNNLNNVGRDTYTWALPIGDTIAFSVGFATGNGYVMKSFDNGETWDQISVYENPYSTYSGGATPHFGAGDGTSAIALDSDGKAHVVFSRMIYYYDEMSTTHYFPATEGLIYWNESMPMLDTTSVSSYTLEHLEEGGNLIGWFTGGPTLLGFGTYYLSLTTWPQILIDEYDRIFVVYSGVSPICHNGVMNYRHVFLNSSDDIGETWNGIEDLNSDLLYSFSECIFPAISPKIEQSKLRLCFQEDYEIGLYVWIGQQQFLTENKIRYMEVEVDSVVNTPEFRNQIKNGIFCFNYPNPFSDITSFNIQLKQQSHVALKIHDVTGKQRFSSNLGLMNKGTNTYKFENQNLDTGIYFFSLDTDYGSITGKMIVR